MRKDRLLIPCLLLAGSTWAIPDSGVVRVSRIDGPWRLTVFSEPTPLRAGLVDLSVLVQRPEDDEPVLDATVSLMLEPADGLASSMLVEATREAATNRLLYSAKFELPEPGAWNIEVAAMHGKAISRVSFQVDAAEAIPPILDMWIWFAIPGAAILLVVLNQWLQRRGKPSRRRTAA